MSVQALSWVLDHSKSRANARLVLISIANHARADGSGAWPSDATVASEAGLAPRTVRRLINETLEPSGELVITRRPGRPNLYDLPGVRGEIGRVDPGQNGRPYPGQNAVETPASSPCEPRPALAAEPKATEPQPSKTLDVFEVFWTSFPRRIGKGAARRAWVARIKAGASADELVDGARRYREWVERGNVEPRYVCHPSTWLNQEREKDDLSSAGSSVSSALTAHARRFG